LRLFPTFGAHQFRESVQDSVAHGPYGLRGYISKRNTGAARRHHQARRLALLAQRILNFPLLVGHHQAADHVEGMRLKQVGHHRPGNVNPLSQKAGIAHGNDSGMKHKQ
jgi:hypothetical protein